MTESYLEGKKIKYNRKIGKLKGYNKDGHAIIELDGEFFKEALEVLIENENQK